MAIEHTVSEQLITWDHADGVCKLILVSRDEIDEDSDEPDAWDLMWIDAAGNFRRFEARLDPAYGRGIETWEREQISKYAETAPQEAVEILAPWIAEQA